MKTKPIFKPSSHNPDIVSLDIERPVANGFDLLRSISSINNDVIFVAAYGELATKAFEFNAVDYLLNPVLKSKLIQAVQKITQKRSPVFQIDHLDTMVNNKKRDQDDLALDAIAIPTQEGFEMIQINDITHLLAEGNYTWLHLNNEKKLFVSKPIKDITAIINRNFFFRAHKSYLVNLNYVHRYIRGRGGYLILRDNSNIPVSRNQRQELMRLLNL